MSSTPTVFVELELSDGTSYLFEAGFGDPYEEFLSDCAMAYGGRDHYDYWKGK